MFTCSTNVPQACCTDVPELYIYCSCCYIREHLMMCVCASVVIMCMSSLLIGGEDQGELLLEALEMGMVSKGYIFIPYDALLYAMPYQVTN